MLASPELIADAAVPKALAKLLPRYLAEVPLYQREPALFLPASGFTLEEWQRLPFITKVDIRRDFPRNFLGAAADLESLLAEEILELEHTSGTSEERTPLLLPHGWWAEQEGRALRLNAFVASVLSAKAGSSGRESAPSPAPADQSRLTSAATGIESRGELHPEARRITIASPVCSSDICYTGVPSREERMVGNTLFLSLSRYPFLWTEADLARMVAEAVEWEPVFLDLDPVYGVVFALYCERRGIRLPSLKFILCSYEFVSVNHRRILQRVFGVPVFNLYGSTETGHLLMEDPDGLMRASLETAWLELVDVDAHGIGELIVTTLTNHFMPLVRYRIGDLVERRPGPDGTRYVVHGRAADTLVSADGQRVTTWQLDECFKDLPGIAHYQLLQRSASEWSFRYVADPGVAAALKPDEIRQRLSHLLQTRDGLKVEATELLIPESSGKFKLTSYPGRQSRS